MNKMQPLGGVVGNTVHNTSESGLQVPVAIKTMIGMAPPEGDPTALKDAIYVIWKPRFDPLRLPAPYIESSINGPN